MKRYWNKGHNLEHLQFPPGFSLNRLQEVFALPVLGRAGISTEKICKTLIPEINFTLINLPLSVRVSWPKFHFYHCKCVELLINDVLYLIWNARNHRLQVCAGCTWRWLRSSELLHPDWRDRTKTAIVSLSLQNYFQTRLMRLKTFALAYFISQSGHLPTQLSLFIYLSFYISSDVREKKNFSFLCHYPGELTFLNSTVHCLASNWFKRLKLIQHCTQSDTLDSLKP